MMFEQIKGVLFLDSGTFQNIEHDKSATTKAILIVIVSSILAAIGGGFGSTLFGFGLGTAGNQTVRVISIAVWAVLAWFVWSFVTWLIGTKVFKGDAALGEMLRVVGFAYAPLAFQIFSFIPLFGIFVPILVAIWAFAAVIVGVKEGLDLDNGKTFFTVLIGFFLYLIGMGVLLFFIP